MRWTVIILTVLDILVPKIGDCTSSQNLQTLLQHPHYSEGHQHHNQYAVYKTGPEIGKHFTAGLASPLDGGWQKQFPNGYAIKSTSATKAALLPDVQATQELSGVRQASEHFKKIRSNAQCRVPLAQVVCLRDLYPHKELLPRCTLLHRCSAAAGCCENEATRCSPKTVQEVTLHFYVLGDDHKSSKVEKLLFDNHTECECKSISDAVIPEQHNVIEYESPKEDKSKKCKECPSPFSIRQLDDGRCICDCFDRHKPCIRIKKGREPLSPVEKRCVLSGDCATPFCDFGSFDPDTARCPRKPDYDGADSGRRQMPNHKNPNYRWSYLERD